MRPLMAAAALFMALGIGNAVAQTSAPAPEGQPGSTAKMSAEQKKAIAKSCSDQANAKGLHGKARKKFRSECKQAGGKMQQ